MLEPFFDVELVTCTFGSDAWIHAQRSAVAVGFPFSTIKLGPEVMGECIDLILKYGYPRYGINLVHKKALEALAAEGAKYVADGIRRDDRSPALAMPEIKSLEDKYGVSYIRPLAGYGRHAIDAMVKLNFEVEEGPAIEKSDYESEIRSSIKRQFGEKTMNRLFPGEHAQSRVIRRLKK